MAGSTVNSPSSSKSGEGETRRSGGIFSWLSGDSRSPTYGTTETEVTETVTVQNRSGSSPPTTPRSPARSPARFVMGGAVGSGGMGGRVGPIITFNIPKIDDGEEDSNQETHLHSHTHTYAAPEATTTTYVTSSTTEQVPMESQNIQYVTKTIPGEQRTVHYTTSNNNQTEHMPTETHGQTIQYVTTTAAAPAEAGQRTVQYITTTGASTSNHVPLEQKSQNVQYMAASEDTASTGLDTGVRSVRYVTTTNSQTDPQTITQNTQLAGNASGSVTYVTQPTTHVVTKTMASPVRIGNSPARRVQYVTRTMSPVPLAMGSVATTTQQGQVQTQTQTLGQAPMPSVIMPQVQYVTRTVAPPGQLIRSSVSTTSEAPGSSNGQYVTMTRKTSSTFSGAGEAPGSSNGQYVTMTKKTSSTLSGTGSATVVDGVEGLPPPHFMGVHRATTSDSASSDGEGEVEEMVFDIMTQSFKPVNRRAVQARQAAAAGVVLSSSVAGSAVGSTSGSVDGAYGVTSTRATSGAGGNASASASAAAGAALGAAAGASAGAAADVGADATASATASAGAGAAVSTTVETEVEIEEQVSVEETKAGGVGAMALAGGAALSAAVAAGAVTMHKAKSPASAAVPTDKSPAGSPKRRTSSQRKLEPSTRTFFSASAAANEAALVHDHEVSLDMEGQTMYAELRSPSNHSNAFTGDGSRLGHLGLVMRLRKCRWLLLTIVPMLLVLFLMILFYKGVALKKFHAADYSLKERYDMLDDYNGYVALITSLFAKPLELLLALVVPIIFVTFVSTTVLKAKLTLRVKILMFFLGWLLSYLLTNGFYSLNVQLHTKTIEPVISLGDLSLQAAAAASLSALAAMNASSNASLIVSEAGAGNAITNTVLRNVVSTAIAADGAASPSTAAGAESTPTAAPPLLCSNSASVASLAASASSAAAYGFPLRSWQEDMLPAAVLERNLTVNATGTVQALAVLPMSTRTAANLLLHGVHVARDVFRWFDSNASEPLGVQAAIKKTYGAAKNPTGESTYANVADLLNLTTAGSNAMQDVAATTAFLRQARTLFNSSLAGAANVSRAETKLEFTRVTLPNDYAFEAVTMEMPLVKSFLSRRLAADEAGAIVEDTTTEDGANGTYYYDLDIATDCGPYAGECEVRRTEYDASGNVYEPPTTVRAFALCNNSKGTDELEVLVFNGSALASTASYTCNGTSANGMLLVSVTSRIVGDALIAGPSSQERRLVDGMATIRNPRKIYSLTVGKLSWPTANLAIKFNAACAAGVGRCTGLHYALNAAIKNATESLREGMGHLRGSAPTSDEDAEEKYLIVGSDFLPTKALRPVAYNTTEAPSRSTPSTSDVAGYALVSVDTPLQADTDAVVPSASDLVLTSNFESVSWAPTAVRRGAQCSASVEARLSRVLNNHYYMQRGVQPAYTAGMYFLFQDAVTKSEVALATGSRMTLSFLRNIEFLEMHLSIPLVNFVLTLIGCGVILCAALVIALWFHRRSYSVTEGDDSDQFVGPQAVARVKLEGAMFPALVLDRRVVDMTRAVNSTATTSTASSIKSPRGQRSTQDDGEDVDAFTVGSMRMDHDRRDMAVDMPYSGPK